MIQTAINGLCMALADSVPGVSGGTIAFVLGFYDRFIDALHGLFTEDRLVRRSSLLFLSNLGAGWGVGMCASIILLSDLFTRNIYFMSSVFLGLTTASVPFIVSAEKESISGKMRNMPFALLGCAAVVALSFMRSYSTAMSGISFSTTQPLDLVYIFFSGIIAISAMVLPGMSGSTVLLIAGVYLPAVTAVRSLLAFEASSLPGICALGLGTVFGISITIRLLRKALRKHRSQMMWLILGLLVGSLYAIVMGPTTLAVPEPALDISTFSFVGFSTGIIVLLILELLRKFALKNSYA